jgi:hypothetical protein
MSLSVEAYMHKKQLLFSLPFLLLLTLGLVACGEAEPEEVVAHDPIEWTWLQETKEGLTTNRQEIKHLAATLAGKAEASKELAALAPEELQEKVTALASEIEANREEYMGRLVDFINKGIDADAEASEIHAQALALKSDEDILVALEYIDKGGDYSRAIGIMKSSLNIDPDNPVLQQALADAEKNQFMTEERFGLAKKGMTTDEVRELLGTIKRTNAKDYPEKKTKAWFYKKAEGGAAGVFFTEKKDAWVVYKTDFGAIPKPEISTAKKEGDSAG